MSSITPIPTAKSDGDILHHLQALAKHIPDYSVEAMLPASPIESLRQAMMYELAERTIRTARFRLQELDKHDSQPQSYHQLLKSLKELCGRLSLTAFPQDLGNDEYFLQVFQNLTTALSRLTIPADGYWISKRLAQLRLRHFKDYGAFLPVLDTARLRVSQNSGTPKFAIDLAWTLDAALTEMRAISADRDKIAGPLFLEMEQTVGMIPESSSKINAIRERVEHHRQWLQAPPGEYEGWNVWKEWKDLQEQQELNEGTVEQFLRKYDSLGLAGPSRLHSAFIRLLLSVRDSAPNSFVSFFKKHGVDAFSPDDFRPQKYNGKAYSPLVLRVARTLAKLLAPKTDNAWGVPFLENGIAISPELKLLQALFKIALTAGDLTKCKLTASQLVKQDPGWFKHWEMLAYVIQDDPAMRLSCLSAGLLCPVSKPIFMSRVLKQWRATAHALSPSPISPEILAQVWSDAKKGTLAPSVAEELSRLARPAKEAFLGELKWLPAVILAKAKANKGVFEAFFMWKSKGCAVKGRLERHPEAAQLHIGHPIDIRVQKVDDKLRLLDLRLREGRAWDALPQVNAEVTGYSEIGSGLRVRSSEGNFVLPSKSFPDVQKAPLHTKLIIRLRLNRRTNLNEPVDAQIGISPDIQSETPIMGSMTNN